MILVLYLSSSQKTIKYSLEQNEYIQVKQQFFYEWIPRILK